ncbi:hypothetical protein ARMSODRAFT_449296 [Armillaria solidipes]|uniref:Uncharacterized protein n=1 Tax=Armillaria solidipes TaxID=1076256 RepID=A0A2H3BD57_9AGAR|nr:hypothetical protein ARMSODRAFT_449296 [Armillaria solidipes]
MPARLPRNAASSAALTVYSWIGRSRLLGFLAENEFSKFCMIFRCFLLVPAFDFLCRLTRNSMHSRLLKRWR